MCWAAWAVASSAQLHLQFRLWRWLCKTGSSCFQRRWRHTSAVRGPAELRAALLAQLPAGCGKIHAGEQKWCTQLLIAYNMVSYHLLFLGLLQLQGAPADPLESGSGSTAGAAWRSIAGPAV